MFNLTPTLKRFQLVPLLLCFGLSLALNLRPALCQAQTVTLSVDSLFVHYSALPMGVTVTAELSAPRTQETTITLRLTGTAGRGTDYTTDDSLPTIIIAAEATSGTARLFIGGPPDDITERDIKTIIVRGRASGVSVTPATITLVKDDEAQDRAALQALYRATNGAGWTANTNWNSPAALNTWHGVTTNPDGRVVTLDLSNNNLTGSIPPQVGGLAALQVLDLSNNDLTGSIPPQVGDLTALIHLDLSDNKLSDSIPDLNSLTALIHLDLSNNTLSGTIPAEVGSLHNLIHLDLSANNLTGSIPALNSLTTLTHLDLSANNLSGSIPTQVDGLEDLQVLDLSANDLTGSIPALTSLTALTHLDLSANNLTGRIPDLDSLTTLLYLDLSNNALSGSLPALPALNHLDLSENDLSGSVPDISRVLPFLQFLDLSHNRFRGLLRLGLSHCRALLNLTHFDLSHNQLTGPVPASLGRLSDLTHLDFSHNRFSGPLPVELGGTINFTCINDEGEIVGEERQLDDLTWLDLSHNQLTGPVPASLGGLEDLTHLDLSNNQLSGPLHPSLGSLGNLGVLTLDSDTGLCRTAVLDEWLRRLGVTLPLCGAGEPGDGGAGETDVDRDALLALYRATNGREWTNEVEGDRIWNPSAPLNTWYGVTTNDDGRVTALHLDNNNLHGFIPPELGDLTNLQILDLSNNQLAGLIPFELDDLPDLQVLHLDGNRLRGALPDSLFLLDLDALTLDSDTGLCRTAALEEWLRRLGVTLPPCRATTENRLILTSGAPTSVPGQLLSVDEVNSFQLDIHGPGGILIVETTGDTDTFGSLTQEGTRAVTTDEDSGEDNNFRIAQPVSNGTYSVAVSGGGETGEYTLVVRYIPGVLGNPQPGSFQSGIGVISGWVCEADQVVIEFERPGGTVRREPAAYGTSRPDTAGECGHPDSGFGLLWNWNKLGPGKHTVRAMVDGVVLAEHTLMVTTLGLGEFPKGLRGDYQLEDFPNSGDTTRLLWQEAQQNFVIAAETGGGGGGHQNPEQAVLGNPQPGSFQSGIGVISGWVCEADQVVIEFESPGGTVRREQAGYGTSRTDTSGKCGDSANGFGLLWNWNNLGPGQHTIRALADGFEFAWSTFTVTTLGEEGFVEGLDGEYELEDFPEVGTTVTVKWQKALQNFTITGVE